MSTVRTHAGAPQTQTTESFFGRIGRVLRETFNPPASMPKEKVGPDRYVAGTPHSLAAARRLASQNAGRGVDGSRGRNASQAPSRDANLVAYLDNVIRTGNPMA